MKEIKRDETVTNGRGGRAALAKVEGERFLGGLQRAETGIIGRRQFI